MSHSRFVSFERTAWLCQSGQHLLVRRLLRSGGLSSQLVMGVGCLVAAVAALPLALLPGQPPKIRSSPPAEA